MSKFQVGDLVAVYWSRSREVGTVEEIFGDGSLIIRLESGLIAGYHPKQCRRLVKRKRREVYVNVYPNSPRFSVHPSVDVARAQAMPGATEVGVRFVEAKKKC